jgi:hypothetical protein
VGLSLHYSLFAKYAYKSACAIVMAFRKLTHLYDGGALILILGRLRVFWKKKIVPPNCKLIIRRFVTQT